MIRTALNVVGWLVALGVGFAVLWLLFIVAGIYVFKPLMHRWNVSVAERQNDETYQSGTAHIFEVVFQASVAGEARSETRSIICVPKREAQLTFKEGALTWDMMRQISPDLVRVPVAESRDLVFRSADLNCYQMVESFQSGSASFAPRGHFGLWLSGQDLDEAVRCSFWLRDDPVVIGALEVERPRVVDAREVPLASVLSREEYGPADRALMPQDTLSGPWPRITYHLKPDAGCWEARVADQVCSEEAARICGFP